MIKSLKVVFILQFLLKILTACDNAAFCGPHSMALQCTLIDRRGAWTFNQRMTNHSNEMNANGDVVGRCRILRLSNWLTLTVMLYFCLLSRTRITRLRCVLSRLIPKITPSSSFTGFLTSSIFLVMSHF